MNALFVQNTNDICILHSFVALHKNSIKLKIDYKSDNLMLHESTCFVGNYPPSLWNVIEKEPARKITLKVGIAS